MSFSRCDPSLGKHHRFQGPPRGGAQSDFGPQKERLRKQQKAPNINQGKGAIWEEKPFTRKEESSQ